MVLMGSRLIFLTAIVVLTIQVLPGIVGAAQYHIGVNYGRNGDNLPPAKDVIGLFQKSGIAFIRLFEPIPEVLEALRGSNLTVSLGTRNEDIPNLASSEQAATAWVNTNVVPYKNDVKFGWVTIGNEVIPGTSSGSIPQAMNNINNAIAAIGLNGTKVSTVIHMVAISPSYPPSAGAFSPEAAGVMKEVASFLLRTGSPLMLNVYPYFAYSSDPSHISLAYATFNVSEPVVLDGNLKYYSLFDAMVDSCNAALEKINAGNVTLVISETGWPTAGNDPYASISNAKAYNGNILNRAQNFGTPRRQDLLMDTFIFAMFNENQKTAGVEQNFGLFYPNMQPVYPMF